MIFLSTLHVDKKGPGLEKMSMQISLQTDNMDADSESLFASYYQATNKIKDAQMLTYKLSE